MSSHLNPVLDLRPLLHLSLSLYPLRYDDLYDPKHDLDIKEVLEGLPREVVDAQHQRLKRATDLSMKCQYLSDFQVVFLRALATKM
ncbi:hypothetical protein GUJ93_ZPchr0011g27258 [Zizania palustris]|uniref:Uncharacterized protein n=1 Tax=Zizania palustris TaxID=103762 RepID=A0A8J5WLE8_ZIZPA|nr:hypothetical protein GUJ93_ZPchr0011g27258 [Zizania palustris]